MTRPAVPRTAIARALASAAAAGLEVTGITTGPDGAVTILTRRPANAPITDLERWRAEVKGAGRAA